MKKYVMVGNGARSLMFVNAFKDMFSSQAQLLGLCDKNQGRMEANYKSLVAFHPNLQMYSESEFETMILENKPDTVIVCTMDSTHDHYICKAMELGCDVITEKPMTTDEIKCQRIVDTAKRTGKKVRVTFNYRYSPPRSQIKQMLMDGIIGKVLSVEFQWFLDTSHGADYYRRWHRRKENSGGLMVHKATHHFDLVNWWLSDIPDTVYAQGGKTFYGQQQAKRYGLENHGTRCLDCPVSSKCNFFLDLKNFDILKELYLDNEEYDGYLRDRCVFNEDINIEDVMNVLVTYKSGVFLSYSLASFMPYEGYRVAFNGTKGRLEQHCHESSYISGDGRVQGAYQPEKSSITVFPHFSTPYQVEVASTEGSHGGGDPLMLTDIFDPSNSTDPLKRAADYAQGAYSILVGTAANKSMQAKKLVKIDELVKGLPNVDFPPMPDGSEQIEYIEEATRVNSHGERTRSNVPVNIAAPE